MKSARYTKRLAVLLVLAALALGVCASAALADDLAPSDTPDVELGGGVFTIGAITFTNFDHVDLGAASTVSTEATAAAFAVTDTRGTGAGWHVTVQSSQFTGTYDSDTKTLPTNGYLYLQVVGTPSLDFGGPRPTIDPEIDGALESVKIDNGAVEIASAADTSGDAEIEGQGMGKYTFQATNYHLTIPAGAFATTYTSTVTVTLVTGP